MLSKYRQTYPIPLDQKLSKQHLDNCNDVIKKFKMFIYKAISSMEKQKSYYEKMADARDAQNMNYKILMKKLQEYEEEVYVFYGDDDKKAQTHILKN